MTEIKSGAAVATSADIRGATAMQLRDVAVSFHGRTAVRDCTFDIAKNRVTSLIALRVRARPHCCAPSTDSTT